MPNLSEQTCVDKAVDKEVDEEEGASMSVVLSLFPGVGLLDMGFEAAGFCVVRGPDLLWGSDIRNFDARPLAGKIDGIIGGVPCQAFSSAVLLKNRKNHLNLWPDFWRVVGEVKPKWVMAENVPGAKNAATDMFDLPNGLLPTSKVIVFSDLGSAQARKRLIVFGGVGQEKFFEVLKKQRWGNEWRKRINRDSGVKFFTVNGEALMGSQTIAKYQTVTGDASQQAGGKETRAKKGLAAYLQGDMLLDAFDLPKDWSLPKHGNFSKSSVARLITQGVPVAAAYALAMAIKESRNG